jgi:hypothetical protein
MKIVIFFSSGVASKLHKAKRQEVEDFLIEVLKHKYLEIKISVWLKPELIKYAYEVHALAPLSRNLPLPAAWPYATWKLLLKKRK